MSVTGTSIDQLCINTIRTLAMDAVQQANSGHPGTPMALAPAMYVLWNRKLRFDPRRPVWPNRDRFVLSCGHASMLLYGALHLAGVQRVDASDRAIGELAITLDDIRRFRQLHSPCAGHPEFGEAPGIETTTGPLGQGVGNSVGMAIASRRLAAIYNRPGHELFNFNVYALCSDGDMMEGIGHEAASLAGHLRLSNLCWIYDANRITIEGSTDLAFTEEVSKRMESLGWRVETIDDANDVDAIERALDTFLKRDDGPTLIVIRSVIAYGAPNKQNTAEAHGAPLGEEEIRLTKKYYGWPSEPPFLVPEEVREYFEAGIGQRGATEYARWESLWQSYRSNYPHLAQQLQQMWRGQLPDGWDSDLPRFPNDAKGMATRVASGKVLNAVAAKVPWLMGGSADLAGSNNSLIAEEKDFQAGHYDGRNMRFGVREHAMAAIANGMALCGMRPYAATFFVFSDYMRPALRLSALMRLNVLFIFTHDSIGLGEDGPTHQPIEHLAACRAIPNLVVIRPADASEVTEAYRTALSLSRRPVALVLTRQNVPTLDRSRFAPASGLARGAYVLADQPNAQVILIGTGSELHLCVAAAEQLHRHGVRVRVVSMPCWELFEEQDAAYRQSVLPDELAARVVVEAGVRQGWETYLGPRGYFIGMATFGASAPYARLFEHFGITVEAIESTALRAIQHAS